MAVLSVMVWPAAASAHGVAHGGAPGFWDFMDSGIKHMLAGWDHLLFVAGVLLHGLGLATRLQDLGLPAEGAWSA